MGTDLQVVILYVDSSLRFQQVRFKKPDALFLIKSIWSLKDSLKSNFTKRSCTVETRNTFILSKEWLNFISCLLKEKVILEHFFF